MKINNNKGFSLIEILVTVGLIGVLVSIAVPSYNNYKKGTIKMAVKVDLGNGQKVYGAKYAVDSSYCHTLAEVGISKDKASNPIYKNKGFYGFEKSGADCTQTNDDLHYVAIAGCSDTNHATKAACETANEIWRQTALAGNASTGCVLGTNRFVMGAFTNTSNIDTMMQGNDKGVIQEHSGKDTCQLGAATDPDWPAIP